MSLPRVFIGYPHPGVINHEFHYSLLRATMAPPDYQVYVCGLRSGVSIARSRNRLVALFLNSDCDYLLMCDSDGAWSPFAISKLIARDVPIVAGHAMGQEDPSGERLFSAVLVLNGDGHLHRREEMGEGLVEVDAVGMHFTLIRRDVLETLGTRPQFPFAATLNRDEATRTISDMGEDSTFCRRAKLAGFSTYVDYDCPIGHIKDRLIWPPNAGKDPLDLSMTPEWKVETLT